MNSRRIVYIDIAKGIGILLVALAHADISLFSPYLHQLIYAFHMPLFFLVSGAAHLTLRDKAFRQVAESCLGLIFLAFIVHIAGAVVL